MDDKRLPHLDGLWPTNGATSLRISPQASSNIDRALTAKDEVTQALAAALQGDHASSLSVAAVYASVRLLSETVAALPLALYEREGETDRLAADHPLTDVLDTPNSWQTPHDFWALAMTHLLMRGNFYARIARRDESRVDALIPIAPQTVRPKQDERGAITYEIRQSGGSTRVLAQSDVLHVRALTTDGLIGIGPLEAARRTVEHSTFMRRWNSGFFQNGARPTGVLKHPGVLSTEAFDRLKNSFDESYSGTENAGRPMILEEGLSWDSLSLTAEDLQFIDGMKFSRGEIAMFFGVPPHMIGDIERGTSWGSGLEQQNLGFLIYSLRPWLTNIAQAMRRDLIAREDRRRYVLKFDTSDLTRADFKARQEGLQIQRNAGVISVNEWRRAENLNPIESGDDYSAQRQPAFGADRKG